MALLAPVLGYDQAWSLTPHQLYHHVLMRQPEQQREMKDLAVAFRMAQNAKPEDFKRWLKQRD